MIWNTEIETADRAKLNNIQSERLLTLIRRVYNNNDFYREKFKKARVKPSDIKSIEDIVKLPFTSKVEMINGYPYGLLSVDKKYVVEIHSSSGTTTKPVSSCYTANDIELWSEVMARSLTACGVTANDTIQNAYGYGLFTGGFGFHYGARKIGANLIPVSGGNTKRQLMIMQDFGTDILTCTPSYSLHIADVAKETGTDFSQLQLRAGVFGAEPWTESMRNEIQSKLSIKAYDIYGLTEIIGPGVAIECEYLNGLHIFEDVFYPEVIDPKTGELLPPGSQGELVLTTLTREATPVIRYRTRDIVTVNYDKCKCGRTHVKMSKVVGRTDDMLIIRGVNVFPSQIEEVLLKFEETEPHYQLIVNRKSNLDCLEVYVEMTEKLFSDEIKEIQESERKIENELYNVLNLKAKVTLVQPGYIKRTDGKAQRIIDKRNFN